MPNGLNFNVKLIIKHFGNCVKDLKENDKKDFYDIDMTFPSSANPIVKFYFYD